MFGTSDGGKVLTALEESKKPGTNELSLKGIEFILIKQNEKRMMISGLTDQEIGLQGVAALIEVLKTNTHIKTLKLQSEKIHNIVDLAR